MPKRTRPGAADPRSVRQRAEGEGQLQQSSLNRFFQPQEGKDEAPRRRLERGPARAAPLPPRRVVSRAIERLQGPEPEAPVLRRRHGLLDACVNEQDYYS